MVQVVDVAANSGLIQNLFAICYHEGIPVKFF